MNKLENLIAAIKCPEYEQTVCKNCPYDYQVYLKDDSTNKWYYDCDRVKMLDDALNYLESYADIQYEIFEELKHKYWSD